MRQRGMEAASAIAAMVIAGLVVFGIIYYGPGIWEMIQKSTRGTPGGAEAAA